ncbi:hypothetical protein BJV78DRAFT_837098 [Lactifluus subvellereus]|nr:hypothetical protein BJV78DRAFT_837098 [Lactifluus subvellereus]
MDCKLSNVVLSLFICACASRYLGCCLSLSRDYSNVHLHEVVYYWLFSIVFDPFHNHVALSSMRVCGLQYAPGGPCCPECVIIMTLSESRCESKYESKPCRHAMASPRLLTDNSPLIPLFLLVQCQPPPHLLPGLTIASVLLVPSPHILPSAPSSPKAKLTMKPQNSFTSSYTPIRTHQLTSHQTQSRTKLAEWKSTK